jgi:hypothetical protein
MAAEDRNSSPDPLERLVHHAVRQLPARRAPSSLEGRVLRELERRAALPWWRRSFRHWPVAARAAFLAVCIVLIRLAFIGGALVIAEFGSLTWTHRAAALMVSGGNLAAALARIVPPTWLYDGVALCALLYAVLFALGAAGYRTLYLQSPPDGSTT